MTVSNSDLMSPDGARAAIIARHMTQADAAKLMGYSRSALNRFLNGSRGPSERMARALVKVFGNPVPHRVVAVVVHQSTIVAQAPPTIVVQARPPRKRHSFIKQVLASGIGNVVFWLIFIA